MIFFEVLLPLTAFCFCFNLYLGMPLLREKLRRVGAIQEFTSLPCQPSH